MFTLDEIEEIIRREVEYTQRYRLKYYIHEHVPHDERDLHGEGIVLGLEKAVHILRENKLSRTTKLP